MPKWPIRVKLIAGLSLVVGMMLTLMGGSIFGLHSFHTSNLSLVDQLRELGASMDLLEEVVGLELSSTGTPEGDTAACLATVPLLEGMSQDELFELARIVRRRALPAGEVLWSEGDEAAGVSRRLVTSRGLASTLRAGRAQRCARSSG